MTPIEQAVEALKWYGEKAQSLGKHDWKNDGNYAEAIFTELCLDCGIRSVSALTALQSEQNRVKDLEAEVRQLRRRLNEIADGAAADEADLQKMRDGTKLTRYGVVSALVYSQQDVRELRAEVERLRDIAIAVWGLWAHRPSQLPDVFHGLLKAAADEAREALERKDQTSKQQLPDQQHFYRLAMKRSEEIKTKPE